MGVGFFSASILAFLSLDADATKIEYFATVGEPQCELKYASSDLGYYDVIVEPTEEAPHGKLASMSSFLELS
ncbi:hypothetical protein CRYUN_Cryun17cG0088800 [Craigia yunnanensis]